MVARKTGKNRTCCAVAASEITKYKNCIVNGKKDLKGKHL